MSKRERSPGHWEIKIYVGQAAGKEQYEYFTFIGGRREADAEEARLKAKYGKAPAASEGRNYTVEQFLQLWLRDRGPALGYRTRQSYEEHVNNRIIPALGKERLRKLGVGRIQRFLTDLRDQRQDGREGQLSAQTVQRVRATLSAALRYAVQCGYIDSNPAAKVQLPDDDIEFEGRMLDMDEIVALLRAASGSRHYALYLTAVCTGMRLGELLGLRWQDVDLDRGIISVRQSLKDVTPNGPVFGPPKSKKSRRQIRISDPSGKLQKRQQAQPEDLGFLVAELRSHKARQNEEKLALGADYVDYSLVFTATGGKPIRRNNLSRRDFANVARAAGLTGLRFHDLRHTNATLLADEGLNAFALAKHLGHSQISTTEKYVHVPDQNRAVNAIDAKLNPRKHVKRHRA